MKHYIKLFFAAAVAALGLASCAKEVAPVETPKDNLVTVHFGATAGIEGATKATLTPNEQETLFTSAWENGDKIFIQYENDKTTATTATGTWNGTKFEATMPSYTGMWEYTACYPNPANAEISFGTNRTQKGNLYNSNYDVMIAPKISCDHADAGKDDSGNDVVFNMERQTGIVYFHLKSELNNEDVISAKLSVEGGNIASSDTLLGPSGFTCEEDLKEITITFEEGTAPKASDFQLWYNVLPTAYTSMSLEVKTAKHTLTLNKNKGGNFVAGKLYKIHKDNVTWTENKNVTFFYESFDSCDGTGGNDGQWSGNIATSTVRTDNNANWTFENVGGANACVKLGFGSSLGKATTPKLGINTSTAKLSFKAGAWDGNNENTTIKVTANNGGTVEPSTITLKKGQWTDYTCTISGATETTTLTFAASQASKNRFFLDEVMVYYGEKPVIAKKLEQNITFEKGNYSVLLADKDSFVSPKVNGAKTPVSYSITLGEGVAQDAITIDPITGKVTINAVGTATITATAEETEEYKAASANYVLTVTEKSEGDGPAVFGKNWNTLFGTSYTGTFNPKANALTLNGSVNGVSIEVKNGTSTNGLIRTGDFRAYNGYTITFTAPEGRTIKSIVSTKGGKTFTSGVKADSGELKIKNNAISWTGDSKTVKLTISGTVSFATITVTL